MLIIVLQADDEDEGGTEEGQRYDYSYMMKRDKRRWAKADQNGDGLLTKAEFSDFLHPEEVEHMKDVVIDVSYLHKLLIANFIIAIHSDISCK